MKYQLLNNCRWLSLTIILLSASYFSVSAQDFAAKQNALKDACNRYSQFDLDADGSLEIVSLERIKDGNSYPYEVVGRRNNNGVVNGTVLIIVELRLFNDHDGATSVRSIRPSLKQYVQDLSREGYDVFSITAQIYDGKVHKDGRIVLSLRRFIQELYRKANDLKGVVLVGNFPEAFIIRQYFWKKYGKVTVNKKRPNERKFEKVHYWADIPERVAKRADIVLADMDGKWETIYHQAKEKLHYFVAVFPDGTGDDANGATSVYELGEKEFEDFFFIHDGRWKCEELRAGEKRFLRTGPRNDECSDSDLNLPNPMARPEIFVGRINTWHIAVMPKKSIKGIYGEGLLSDDGLPQVVTFKNEAEVPDHRTVWEHSEAMERKLLVEYFQRNHNYRIGRYNDSRKPACITTEWGSSLHAMKNNFSEWKDFSEEGYDVHGKNIDLIACIRWLKRPALLRALKAHSDPWGCNFKKAKDMETLRKEVGGIFWDWYKEGNRLVPGYKAPWGKLDFPFFRALYENGALPDCPSMYLHTGCDSITPGNAGKLRYNDPRFGHWQHAEGLIYYCNGLVLIGRAKVFNDEPRELFKVLGQGKCWGEAWMHYFSLESQDKGLDTDRQGIRRKKAYFWGLVGDPTLTLYPCTQVKGEQVQHLSPDPTESLNRKSSMSGKRN